MRLLPNMCFVAPIFAHIYLSKPLPFALKSTFTSTFMAKSTYRFLKGPLKNSPKCRTSPIPNHWWARGWRRMTFQTTEKPNQ